MKILKDLRIIDTLSKSSGNPLRVVIIPGPMFLPLRPRGGVRLAQRHGMAPVFGTARMYTKEIPDLPLDQCYGVTSFETG